MYFIHFIPPLISISRCISFCRPPTVTCGLSGETAKKQKRSKPASPSTNHVTSSSHVCSPASNSNRPFNHRLSRRNVFRTPNRRTPGRTWTHRRTTSPSAEEASRQRRLPGGCSSNCGARLWLAGCWLRGSSCLFSSTDSRCSRLCGATVCWWSLGRREAGRAHRFLSSSWRSSWLMERPHSLAMWWWRSPEGFQPWVWPAGCRRSWGVRTDREPRLDLRKITSETVYVEKHTLFNGVHPNKGGVMW